MASTDRLARHRHRVSFLERLSGLAVEHLDRRRLAALRDRYHALRTRFHPVLRFVNGTFGPGELRRHLEERLDGRFEILMVHSSVNHMLPMFTGSPLDVLRTLTDLCGPDRTLAMPAFYLRDERGLDVIASYERRPRFDVRRTPSQMGIVTELFRRTRGVRQSLHPTHRVTALGPLAEVLTAGHETAGTPCGRGTPFEFMAARDTLILGMGKPFEVLTQVHHVEDLMADAFPIPSIVRSVELTLRDERGEEHPFMLRMRKFERRRDMWKLPALMSTVRLQAWTFHGVPFFATRASYVTEDLLAAAGRGLTVFEESR